MNLLSGVKQDFHRPQRTPGAYEWWHFDGTDDNAGLCFSAQFYAGHMLSPYYQEALAEYWKGTKSPLSPEALAKEDPAPPPPDPLDHTGVVFRVFKEGGLLGEFLQEFGPGMLKASERDPALLLGSNRFNWIADGDPPSYALTLQGMVPNGLSLRARLFFTPGKVGLPPSGVSGSLPTHTWVLAAPLCQVEGTFEWCDAEGDVKRELRFLGKGYHDHHFGTVPLGRFVKAWHWGRAFSGGKVLAYSFQLPVDGKDPAQGFLWDGDSVQEAAFQPSQPRRNFFLLPYHRRLDLAGGPSITHRRVLSDGPVSLLFEDEVAWGRGGPGRTAGLSSYLYLPRLSSKFFFPMLKGKTTLVRKAAVPLPGGLDEPGGDVFTDRPDIPMK